MATQGWLVVLTVDRTRPHMQGGRNSLPVTKPPAHVRHRLALDSLYHHRGARSGRAQRDAASVDRPARHLGRHQYPVPVRVSVLDSILRGGAGSDRGPCAVADVRVLAVAAA